MAVDQIVTTDQASNALKAVEAELVGGRYRPVHHMRDGGHETIGAKADAAATDTTSPWSVVALLKGILGALLARAPFAGLAYTDRSIAAATGASQQIFAANGAARKREIINDSASATTWTINPTGGTAVAGAAGCFTLAPGNSWRTDATNQINGISTTGAKLTALEA